MATDEQKERNVSPLPWTMHTNTDGKSLRGEAFIRASDPDHGILGEIVADVMEEDDAWYIVEMSKADKKVVVPATVRKAVRTSYEVLSDCLNEEYDQASIEEALHQMSVAAEKFSIRID